MCFQNIIGFILLLSTIIIVTTAGDNKNCARSRSNAGIEDSMPGGEKILTAFTAQNGITVHGLKSDPIIVKDTHTIVIPNLYYDGFGPKTYFMVGNGSPPPEFTETIPGKRIPNEHGNCDVLKPYTGETITLTLPSEFNIHSIDWIAMHCIMYKHTFGYVVIPKNLQVPEGSGQMSNDVRCE